MYYNRNILCVEVIVMIQEKFETRIQKENKIRMVVYGLCALFTLFTLARAILVKDAEDILICMATMFLLRLPNFLEKKLKCRIRLGVYIFSLFYVVCPVLGNIYQFYYTIPWWDKFMHGTGGVILAMLGIYMPYIFNKDRKNSILLCAFFGLFFTISMAAIWEFYEYAVDNLVGNDMQKDTYVYHMYSYLLADNVGKMQYIPAIESISLNGEVLKAYIDIGLHDTMIDMILESVCGLVYVLYYIAKKGKNPAFQPIVHLMEEVSAP